MIKQEFTKLVPVSIEKTVVFYAPVIEGRDVLVRTGSLDPDSFYHSVLHCTSRQYAVEKEKKRVKLLAKFKKSLEKKVEPLKVFPIILQDIYSYVLENKETKNESSLKVIQKVIGSSNVQTYKVLFEILTLDNFQNILKNVSDIKEIIPEQEKNLKLTFQQIGLDMNRRVKCLEKFRDLTENIISNCGSQEDNTPQELSSDMINRIQDKINRDIFIIEGVTRLPYTLGQEYKKRKSIVLINIKNHFEPVGKLITERNGEKRVQREFFTDDDIIRRIVDFLEKGIKDEKSNDESSSESSTSDSSSEDSDEKSGDDEDPEENPEEETDPEKKKRKRKEKEKRLQAKRKMDRKRNSRFYNFYP